MSLTPGELARAAAEKAFHHDTDVKRAASFHSRGLDEEKLAQAITRAWANPRTEWIEQPKGGIRWMDREQGLFGVINLKDATRGTVVPCSDQKELSRQRQAWLNDIGGRRGATISDLNHGPVPVGRAIREREFRDNLATIVPRKFSDLVRDSRGSDRDELQRDERSR